MQDIYIPSTTFSPYRHDPIGIILSKIEGYIIHAMSEYIHRSGLTYIKQYDKKNEMLFNRPLKDYPEWLEADYWLHLRGLSCTSFIKPDGTLQICKNTNEKAYHAGKSRWKNSSNLNGKFIGSEVLLEGKNDYATFIRRINNEDWVKEKQYKTLAWEIVKTINAYGYSKENIVSHSQVSGDDVRGEGKGKQDPGNGFNWDKLYYYITQLQK